MIYLLTQNDCPKCENLKQFFQHGLNGKYDQDIAIVNRQDDEEHFMNLVKKYEVKFTPCLIAGEDVLRQPSIANVEEFILKHKY